MQLSIITCVCAWCPSLHPQMPLDNPEPEEPERLIDAATRGGMEGSPARRALLALEGQLVRLALRQQSSYIQVNSKSWLEVTSLSLLSLSLPPPPAYDHPSCCSVNTLEPTPRVKESRLTENKTALCSCLYIYFLVATFPATNTGVTLVS